VKVQRLRVTFTRGDEMKYVTHLDMMRFWERALVRAGIPVAYSEGFSPHAQIALAAPLPVGTTSDGELLDVFTERAITPREFIERVSPQVPPAIGIIGAQEVGLTLPAMQADVRSAVWEVDVPDAPDRADAAVKAFLAKDAMPWEHKREDEVRQYDIRAQVRDAQLSGDVAEGGTRVRMVLQNDNSGSGRPEQVAAAMGLGPPLRIHRLKLLLDERSPVMEAYRKRGRFDG
jgi:radical SAM-linked protein